jgi:uncharacterized protein (UPF0147 family)|tara:strand:- start:458 stop:1345 length:888 start_codon:yes stop_codon:yes gene_type:complete
MADAQVGNTQQESPDVDILDIKDSVSSVDDSAAFFDALDKSANGIVYDEPSQITSDEATNNTVAMSPDEGTAVEPTNNTDTEVLQNRYSASSREAKRLNSRLGELEPYVPILDAMREDPNLISHVRTYFEGGGNTPKSMKEQFNLGEDFMFDGSEAFDNPDSDSAKVLNATIDGLVQRRLTDFSRKQQSENQRLNSEEEFKQAHDMDGDQWTEFVDFAKNKKLSLEDIYYLKNRETRDRNIQRSAQNEVSQQMQNMRERPQSLASAGSTPTSESSPDDKVFDQLLDGDNINRLLG